MSILECIILAIIEGLTEFLPVSSTGHMIIGQGLMGMESTEYVKAFTVMIQFGAILSVLFLYWKRFFIFEIPEAVKNNPQASATERLLSRFGLYWKLLVALIPAVILGFLFDDWVDKMLGSIWIVAVVLLLGGIFMLFVDKLFEKSQGKTVHMKNAFVIGLFQCLAIFLPGLSRSMATIVGGQQQGLSRKVAAEFSFFLAVPTMLGATLLKAYKLYKAGGVEIFQEHMTTLLLGNIVAFVVAMAAIKFFIGFLTKYGFKAFGWYRIIVGALLIILMLAGVPLSVL